MTTDELKQLAIVATFFGVVLAHEKYYAPALLFGALATVLLLIPGRD